MDVTPVISALRREQDHLDEQIKSMEERKAAIDTAISVLQDMQTEVLEIDVLTSHDTPDQVEQPPRSLEWSTPPSREEGPQAIVLRLMKARPGQQFDSKSAYELLKEEGGWESKSSNPVNVVRTALSTLAAQKEIVRRGRGTYAYVVDQQERPREDTSPTSRPYVPGELDLTAPGYEHPTETDEDRRAHDPFAPHPLP